MADGGEKTAPTEDVHQKPTAHSIDNQETGEIPSGWMYRSRKIGPIKFPWYASPESQLLLVAFTCFLCPGKTRTIDLRQWRKWLTGVMQECSMPSTGSVAAAS